MDKELFFELAAVVRKGERVRVLFDMIMELIDAEPEIKKIEFWEGIKNAIENENKARVTLGEAALMNQMKNSNAQEVSEGWNEVQEEQLEQIDRSPINVLSKVHDEVLNGITDNVVSVSN